MSSIMTNSSAMTALQTLQGINNSLESTQSRISTGYRVADASDNAAYWSIATTMRSDVSALGAVKDALGLGAATVDVAYTAMDSAIDVTNEIKSKLVAARQPGVDRDKVQSEITELQNQLKNTADSAVFNGENWLSVNSDTAANPGYNATKGIVSSFSRTGDSVSISTMDVDTTKTMLYDANAMGTGGILDKERTVGTTTQTGGVATINIAALTDDPTDLQILEDYIQMVDDSIGEMTNAATNLGSIKNRVGLQQEFIGGLVSAIERGVGQLVDADLNQESTRLKALQTQQQLGIQALSIANSSSQQILSLFR